MLAHTVSCHWMMALQNFIQFNIPFQSNPAEFHKLDFQCGALVPCHKLWWLLLIAPANTPHRSIRISQLREMTSFQPESSRYAMELSHFCTSHTIQIYADGFMFMQLTKWTTWQLVLVRDLHPHLMCSHIYASFGSRWAIPCLENGQWCLSMLLVCLLWLQGGGKVSKKIDCI